MEQFVTQAQDAGGGWVQIVMHHVCPQAPCDPSVEASGVTADQLGQFLVWLSIEVDAGRVQVETTDEVIGGGEMPLVPCSPVVDAGPDAGSDGGASLDGGTDDAGADAGLDAGIDAGLDAGSAPDAGFVDAGLPDAHESPDTGPAQDAGYLVEDSGPPMGNTSGGCGCSSSGPLAALWLAVPLIFLGRKRRSRLD